jgi:predicted helicase
MFFPENIKDNICIFLSGTGSSKGFTCLVSNNIVCMDAVEKSQVFPLYYFEEREKYKLGLFDDNNKNDQIKKDGISDYILDIAKKLYGKNVSKEDLFYYVYGFLHNKGYIETFANDLKKMLPRLPLVENVKDFWKFSNAGRQLAELHLNYESVPPYSELNVIGDDGKSYIVDKMRFPKKDQKDSINYNSKISITNIPDSAYEYVINGKSAIEWIMERYQITTHKESGIVNDPNDWASESGKPRYILDLLLSVINVSVQTVEIVKDLPKVIFV